MGYSIYATNTFCSTCRERRRLGIIYCPDCGRKVRTHRMSSRKRKGASMTEMEVVSV